MMGPIDPDDHVLKDAASPWSSSAYTDGDMAPTPPSPCLHDLGDDDATPRQQWSPVQSLARARTRPSESYGTCGTSFARRSRTEKRGCLSEAGGEVRGERSLSAASKCGEDSETAAAATNNAPVPSTRADGDANARNTRGGGHTNNARPDSPITRVDLEQLDLSVLALGVEEDSSTRHRVGGGCGGGGGGGLHDRDTFASACSANGTLGVIVGRPRSLGGRPSRSPALFVAPGHMCTGPSSPPSSYSTYSESGFGSPTRRLASPGPCAAREVGRVRKGHWKKGKPIGVGSCGNVYLGMNDDTGELMAVKEITLEAKERLLCSLYNEIQVSSLRAVFCSFWCWFAFVPSALVSTLCSRFGRVPCNITPAFGIYRFSRISLLFEEIKA